MKQCKWLMAWLMVTQAFVANAHTVWLEPADKADTYNVLFGGHADKLETFNPEKLKQIDAFDRNGHTLTVKRQDSQTGSQLTLLPDTALVAIYFDNGIWSKNKMGKSINKPMSAVAGATKATRAVKYHKTVLHWSEQVKHSLGQAFEVIPLNATQPIAGKAMQVKVLLNGKPLAGVRLGHGEIGEAEQTNAQGIAHFTPHAGFNKLWAGKRFQVKQADYTELSYEYLFGFTAVEPK